MVRCPKCAVEVDVDEDEVEEGEILNCPGCEAELEVVQIHPVSVNVISEEMTKTKMPKRVRTTTRAMKRQMCSIRKKRTSSNRSASWPDISRPLFVI